MIKYIAFAVTVALCTVLWPRQASSQGAGGMPNVIVKDLKPRLVSTGPNKFDLEVTQAEVADLAALQRATTSSLYTGNATNGAAFILALKAATRPADTVTLYARSPTGAKFNFGLWHW